MTKAPPPLNGRLSGGPLPHHTHTSEWQPTASMRALSLWDVILFACALYMATIQLACFSCQVLLLPADVFGTQHLGRSDCGQYPHNYYDDPCSFIDNSDGMNGLHGPYHFHDHCCDLSECHHQGRRTDNNSSWHNRAAVAGTCNISWHGRGHNCGDHNVAAADRIKWPCPWVYSVHPFEQLQISDLTRHALGSNWSAKDGYAEGVWTVSGVYVGPRHGGQSGPSVRNNCGGASSVVAAVIFEAVSSMIGLVADAVHLFVTLRHLPR